MNGRLYEKSKSVSAQHLKIIMMEDTFHYRSFVSKGSLIAFQVTCTIHPDSCAISEMLILRGDRTFHRIVWRGDFYHSVMWPKVCMCSHTYFELNS